MKKRMIRSCAAFLLALVMLLTIASAALVPETNVLFTASTVPEALGQIEDTLHVKCVDESGGRLTMDDLEQLEDAVNLYSLALFRELANTVKGTLGFTVTIRFTQPAGDGSVANTYFSASDGVGFHFFLFPRSSPYYGEGTSAVTYLHEFTHLAHMLMTAFGMEEQLEDAFYTWNGTYLYDDDRLIQKVLDDPDLSAFLSGLDPTLSADEAFGLLEAQRPDLYQRLMTYTLQVAQEISADWAQRGPDYFYRQYGTTNVHEDAATIAEGVAEKGAGYAALLTAKPILGGKYASLAEAFRAVYDNAGDAPFLSVLDEDTPDPWAQSSVTRAQALGLLNDELDGAYRRETTRLEFCRMAVLLLETVWQEDAADHLSRRGIDLSSHAFRDVDSTAVSIMAALGVVSGRGNGVFDPNASLTRAEAAKMLALTAAVLGGSDVFDGAGKPMVFADRNSFPAWAVSPIDRLSSANIMNGVGTGFDPNGAYTRQQTTTTLVRLYDFLNAA